MSKAVNRSFMPIRTLKSMRPLVRVIVGKRVVLDHLNQVLPDPFTSPGGIPPPVRNANNGCTVQEREHDRCEQDGVSIHITRSSSRFRPSKNNSPMPTTG